MLPMRRSCFEMHEKLRARGEGKAEYIVMGNSSIQCQTRCFPEGVVMQNAHFPTTRLLEKPVAADRPDPQKASENRTSKSNSASRSRFRAVIRPRYIYVRTPWLPRLFFLGPIQISFATGIDLGEFAPFLLRSSTLIFFAIFFLNPI